VTALDECRRWAVLLVNLGTPEVPTPAAVRRDLAEFLWDPRVVEIPRPVWWLILHGIILRVRPRKSAKAYSAIWTEAGSPLMVFTQGLADRLRAEFTARLGREVPVEIAMRYGKPDIAGRLAELKAQGIERFLILPLYPQYSAPSTGAVFDAVASALARWRHVPEIRFISDYHDHPAYIEAVAERIESFWRENGRSEFLLMSFHGLPEKSREQGDPYYEQCHASARLIARRLQLDDGTYQVVFQSRFGPSRWLQPYCVDVLRELPQRGVREVDVVCPGFAVDCLETLEEIGIANREVFLEAGGVSYRMIPALNDSPEHARALAEVIAAG
jgi:ferrochelatase